MCFAEWLKPFWQCILLLYADSGVTESRNVNCTCLQVESLMKDRGAMSTANHSLWTVTWHRVGPIFIQISTATICGVTDTLYRSVIVVDNAHAFRIHAHYVNLKLPGSPTRRFWPPSGAYSGRWGESWSHAVATRSRWRRGHGLTLMERAEWAEPGSMTDSYWPRCVAVAGRQGVDVGMSSCRH